MLAATQERQMEKRYQRGKSSTVCETDHTIGKANVPNTTEYGKLMEESSISVAQHVERNGWTICSVKEC